MASQCKRKRCADVRKRKAVKKKKSGKKHPEQVWKSQTQEIQAQGTLASLLAFVMPYLCAFGEQAADLQSLELFAGKKAISRATQKFGFQACALDKTYSSEDIMHGHLHRKGLQACVAACLPFDAWLYMLGSSCLL